MDLNNHREDFYNYWTVTFTSYTEAMDYYRQHEGILRTVVPNKVWEVKVYR